MDPCGQVLSRWIQLFEGPPIFLHAALGKGCLSFWRERGKKKKKKKSTATINLRVFVCLFLQFIVAVDSMFLFPHFSYTCFQEFRLLGKQDYYN